MSRRTLGDEKRTIAQTKSSPAKTTGEKRSNPDHSGDDAAAGKSGADASSVLTSDGASSSSSATRRRLRKQREGYVLEDYDKIDKKSSRDLQGERDFARAKRRRKRLLQKLRKSEEKK